MTIEELRENFMSAGNCIYCGSQRCDTSLEWLEGCELWKKFKQEHEVSNR